MKKWQAAVIVGAALATGAWADDTAITEFKNGSLTWSNCDASAYYTVQWRPSLTDTSDWCGSWVSLQSITTTNSTITVPVPMFYRIGVTWASSVRQTGQTASYRTGDDGYFQKGITWPSPRFNDVGDGTVMDNLTGLMWVKAATNSAVNWTNAVDYCNGLTLAGHNDWRLANIQEIRSLMTYADCNYSGFPLPAGNPFQYSSGAMFWSSTTSASETNRAWVQDFSSSVASAYLKTIAANFWPVRGVSHSPTYRAPVRVTGQVTTYRTRDDGDAKAGMPWPVPRFIDCGNGTVTDRLTHLVWAKDANMSGAITWNSAIDYCTNLVLAGTNDWRLPNVLEIESLVDSSRCNPAIPPSSCFTNVQTAGYWSGTTLASGGDIYGVRWILSFDGGSVNQRHKTLTAYVWPVRGGN